MYLQYYQMITMIRIWLNINGNFGFTIDYPMITTDYDNMYCEFCNVRITPIYAEIIGLLKKKDLLPDDFKHICCECFNIRKKIGTCICPLCNEIIVKYIDPLHGFLYYCVNRKCKNSRGNGGFKDV